MRTAGANRQTNIAYESCAGLKLSLNCNFLRRRLLRIVNMNLLNCPVGSTMNFMPAARHIGDREIMSARGAKNPVNPEVPYSYFVESEPDPTGAIADVATLFLSNRECPFCCLFCDL